MPLTAIEFFKLADKLLPKSFNGDYVLVNTFIDSLELLKANCNGQETNAIKFIKTRLTGKARIAVTDNLTTIDDIIKAIKSKCPGEKYQTIELKLESLKQNDEDCTKFIKQVEELSASLLLAYISEGLPADTAENFVKTKVIKTLIANAKSEKTQIVMEAGHFPTLQDALWKFQSVNSSINNNDSTC